jgi:Golgi SNAP receptor complex protein 2
LGALSRLIDDYDSMAKKEMVTAAREKANTWVGEPARASDSDNDVLVALRIWMDEARALLTGRRVARLKTEHRDLKARFDRAKAESQIKVILILDLSYKAECQNRSDLLGSASSSTLQQRKPSTMSESPFAPSQSSLYQPNAPRDDFALREHTFLQESENNIDNYIAQGRAVLENLVEQRGMLKGTKRKLLDAANTLGMSRETIGWVERRTWVQAARPFIGGP